MTLVFDQMWGLASLAAGGIIHDNGAAGRNANLIRYLPSAAEELSQLPGNAPYCTMRPT